MTVKSHLEEALEFLINEEEEKAVSSFHKFIVDRATTIHESLLEDDDLDEEIDSDEEVTEAKDEEVEESKDEEEVTEDKDEEVEESKEEVEESMNEFFGEDDLEGNEFGGEVAGDEMGAEMGDEMGEEITISKDDAEAALSDMESLEARWRELTGIPEEDEEVEMGGEFDAEMGAEMGDEEMGEDRFSSNVNPFAESDDSDEESVEEAVSHGDGVQSTSGTDAKGEGKHGSNSKIAHNSDVGKGDGKIHESEFEYDLTEEDFLDLEEGLKSVDVKMGGEQGHGKFAGEETNTKSPVATKDMSDIATDAKTGPSKQKEHGTYKLEAAPSNDSLPHSGENNHDKAEGTPGRSSVAGHGGPESTSGQGGEQGKKKFAGTETNVKSPIGSAGTRNEK